MSFLFAGPIGSSPNSLGREISDALKELSRPKPEGDQVALAIERAARRAGLSYWRAFDLWYRKARRIDAHEAAQINEAVRLKREKAAADEYQDLKIRLARLEASLLVQANPHVHRDHHGATGRLVRTRG